jgi:hypothetical protein
MGRTSKWAALAYRHTSAGFFHSLFRGVVRGREGLWEGRAVWAISMAELASGVAAQGGTNGAERCGTMSMKEFDPLAAFLAGDFLTAVFLACTVPCQDQRREGSKSGGKERFGWGPGLHTHRGLLGDGLLHRGGLLGGVFLSGSFLRGHLQNGVVSNPLRLGDRRFLCERWVRCETQRRGTANPPTTVPRAYTVSATLCVEES